MKILAIGMNYPSHVKEMNNILSPEPVIFSKPESALLLNNKPFFYPDFSTDIQYETEIVVKIDRLGKNIAPKFAHRYYSEITVGIDFTARDLQKQCKEKGHPWEIAKAFDNSAPVGRMAVKTAHPDIQNINFHLDINGTTVQQGNTKDMIFTVDRIIAHASRFFTLKNGDLIYTGTPDGVGPVKIGDHLQAYLENELVLDFKVK
ncbi:MAG: fumarylacetoacetate hydrolase family protein [Bacteroidales bacterium]|jgi:2-keto-4-pentenoate hydratase/2-oxohepta-3-ene-1,7-dioic acid hydratase in catechol pathway|nr:fumarylacetoacetate hydrolase family protein [Bacteroidales bacterium]